MGLIIDVIALTGFFLAVAGLGMIYLPLAFVAGGLMLIYTAYVMDSRRNGEHENDDA